MAGRFGGRLAAALCALINTAAYDPPFPFNSPGRRYFYSALAWPEDGAWPEGGKRGSLRRKTAVWRANRFHVGNKARFLPIREDLRMMRDLQNAWTEISRRARTHFLGFSQPVEDIRRICDDRKVF